MSPLQKIAMGLVIVVLDADLRGFDAVPDVAGWVLVLAGLRALRGLVVGFRTLLTLAAASALAAAVLLWPGLADSLAETTGWLFSLPQLAFCIVLCGALATMAGHHDAAVARRFSALRWLFVGLLFAPAVLYGGGVEALLVPVSVVTVATNVYLVYLLFMTSSAPYAMVRPDVPVG